MNTGASKSSSFYWALRLLPLHKRNAALDLYAFCRKVDDIADTSECTPEQQRTALETLTNTLPDFGCFPVQQSDLLAIIDGARMDVAGTFRQPQPLIILEKYCDYVAGAVGQCLLAILAPALPHAYAASLAIPLGRAVQLTNILRDIGEDIHTSRWYLPLEYLTDAGIDCQLSAALEHPAINRVCQRLHDDAQRYYQQAQPIRRSLSGQPRFTCGLITARYQALLYTLHRKNFPKNQRTQVCLLDKLWVLLRYAPALLLYKAKAD